VKLPDRQKAGSYSEPPHEWHEVPNRY
jgi:hypothetical protein